MNKEISRGESVPTGLVKVPVAISGLCKDLFREILARDLQYLGQIIIVTPGFAWSWIKKPMPCEKVKSLRGVNI